MNNLTIFVSNGTKVKWQLFLENIKFSIEKGRAIFIGNEKQVKELKELLKLQELKEAEEKA